MIGGTYKPRVRCYDVNNLAMKFERCLDAEVVKAISLSDGYEKLVFLEDHRFVEFHVQYGHYFRTRIPKFGRDMDYLPTDAELYIVGSGSEIYRLNLEQGRFMTSLQTEGSYLNACCFNTHHWLFSVGTKEGKVEAWDPRSGKRVGVLDVAVDALAHGSSGTSIPSVTALAAKDGLVLGVGTGTGLSLLYDIRAAKPLLLRDSHNDLPVTQISFLPANGLVASLDAKALKLWSEESGKPYTAIEPGPLLNSVAFIPDSGLLMMANEAPRVLTYYVPALGPAPKWCAFLDTITEELEETENPSVYDDYKFVTEGELRQLGLEHLVGSSMLRAYMHGYFMDHRLYSKAAALVNPFAFDQFKKQKIRERLEEERAGESVKVERQLPPVNADLALRLRMEANRGTDKASKGKVKSKGKAAGSILEDDRFKALFSDKQFTVDVDSEQYRLLNPALQRIGRSKEKQQKKAEEEEEEPEPSTSRGEEELAASDVEEGSGSESDDTSDDNDAEYKQEMQRAHRQLKKEAMLAERSRREEARLARLTGRSNREFRVQPLQGDKDLDDAKLRRDVEGMELGARAAMKDEEDIGVISQRRQGSGMEMTFKVSKRSRSEAKAEAAAAHIRERRQSRRSAADITKKLKKIPTAFRRK